MPVAQGCQCLVAVLAAKWGLHCCLHCHRGHPKPRPKNVTASPWAHPKQGCWGSPREPERQTVVKHATLKIPLKLMRIWLLAMSRAAAGPCHGLELQLLHLFSPSFSWVHLAVCKHNFIREKNHSKATQCTQKHETSPALEPQSHLFNNNNSTYLHSCQSHVTSAWEKTSRLRVYFWQKYCKEIRLTWVEFYLGIWSLSWWLSHHFCQITLIGCQIWFHNPICNLASSLFSRCYLLYTKQTPNKEVCAV